MRVPATPGMSLGSANVSDADTGTPALSRTVPRTETPRGTSSEIGSRDPVTSKGAKLTASGLPP